MLIWFLHLASGTFKAATSMFCVVICNAMQFNGNIHDVFKDLEKQNKTLGEAPFIQDDIEEKNWEKVLFVKSIRISKARLGMYVYLIEKIEFRPHLD